MNRWKSLVIAIGAILVAGGFGAEGRAESLSSQDDEIAALLRGGEEADDPVWL